MYTPTIDDEVQISRNIYGLHVMFGIVKKKKLSIIDRLKKILGIADSWIEYEYVYGIYDNPYFFDPSLHVNDDLLRYTDKKYNIKNKLRKVVRSLTVNHIKDGFTIHGMIYGKGVHNTYTYELNDIEFVGTDIFEDKNYVAPDAVKLIFDTLLELPHVEIFNTGEWNEDIQNEYTYDNYIENTDKKMPHAGVVVKHVSGDREKMVSIFNPEFLDFIGVICADPL